MLGAVEKTDKTPGPKPATGQKPISFLFEACTTRATLLSTMESMTRQFVCQEPRTHVLAAAWRPKLLRRTWRARAGGHVAKGPWRLRLKARPRLPSWVDMPDSILPPLHLSDVHICGCDSQTARDGPSGTPPPDPTTSGRPRTEDGWIIVTSSRTLQHGP